MRVLKYDANGDGVIDAAAGDRVYIYFGQGRGGSNYYALDVTNKNAPKFMWTIGPAQLPHMQVGTTISQAWSTPQLAKVNISGATQNTQKIVLIFGGRLRHRRGKSDLYGSRHGRQCDLHGRCEVRHPAVARQARPLLT